MTHTGGAHHKKGMDRARSGTKNPVCRIYAHGVQGGALGPSSLCSAYGSTKVPLVGGNIPEDVAGERQ